MPVVIQSDLEAEFVQLIDGHVDAFGEAPLTVAVAFSIGVAAASHDSPLGKRLKLGSITIFLFRMNLRKTSKRTPALAYSTRPCCAPGMTARRRWWEWGGWVGGWGVG